MGTTGFGVHPRLQQGAPICLQAFGSLSVPFHVVGEGGDMVLKELDPRFSDSEQCPGLLTPSAGGPWPPPPAQAPEGVSPHPALPGPSVEDLSSHTSPVPLAQLGPPIISTATTQELYLCLL